MALQRTKQLQMGLLWLIAAAAAASQAIRPDCEDYCGNVRIPYPFGTREGCYYNEDFLITCNSTYRPPIPIPMLRNSDFEVLNISVEDHELRVLTYIARNCYNPQGVEVNSFNASFTLINFPFSYTRNKFTAVGCDTFAVIRDYSGENYMTGCMSLCANKDSLTEGVCSGVGCCQTSITKGLLDYTVSVGTYFNHTKVMDFNPCSYSFLVEADSYTFSAADLANLHTRSFVPTVLDWAVGNLTCEQAKKESTSYACPANSVCNDSDNGPGYRCNCWPGYQGNPYLPNGCIDINECQNPSFNQCTDICKNTEGNYTCSCPKGYFGDGRKDGVGCTSNKSNQLLAVWVGVSSGLGLLFLLIGTWWLYKVMKKRNEMKEKEKFFERNGGLLLVQQLSSSDGDVEKTKLFNSKELVTATDNYNENRVLGQGGQGTIYKGMLTDGRIVAVKKSKLMDEGNVKQFINEIVLLSQINHRNIVNLLGCCLETEVPLLVYEFVSNGTLFQHIHDPNEEFPLSWEMRLRIAVEIAGALFYLHSAASIPIYHRDIKSTNILLDDKYKAKVSDFGTSRSVAIDQTHLTTLVQGTFGYLDPEYFQSSQFTEKSDVYSFGVVIVELLTGQKPISSTRLEDRSLTAYFIQSMKDNHLFEILDPRVLKEGKKEELVAIAELAKRCVHLSGKKRPTMKEVAMELERIRISQGGGSTIQQNCEEVECITIEMTEAWDTTSTSTKGCFDIGVASSLDAQPLLFNI